MTDSVPDSSDKRRDNSDKRRDNSDKRHDNSDKRRDSSDTVTDHVPNNSDRLGSVPDNNRTVLKYNHSNSRRAVVTCPNSSNRSKQAQVQRTRGVKHIGTTARYDYCCNRIQQFLLRGRVLNHAVQQLTYSGGSATRHSQPSWGEHSVCKHYIVQCI